MVLLLFTPIYLTPYNLTPYKVNPKSYDPAFYSTRNRFNTEIFDQFRHPKEQLAKLNFKGIKKTKQLAFKNAALNSLRLFEIGE